MSRKRSTVLVILAAYLLVPLASCAGTSWSGTFEQALEADPQLTGTAVEPSVSPSPTAAQTVALPDDFPTAIPRYPGADLQEVIPAPTATPNSPTTTRWSSPDSGDRILAFYRQQLLSGNWRIVEQPANSNASQGAIVAETTDFNVTVAVSPEATTLSSPTPSPTPNTSASPNATPTEFTIRYRRSDNTTGQVPATNDLANLKLSQDLNIGASGSTTAAGETIANAETTDPPLVSTPNTFTDLDQVPEELQSYVNDLAQLGVLTPATAATPENNNPSRLAPNQAITRRDFARWLFQANNRLNRDRPTQQIRAGLGTAQPAFQDVPSKDPDFAMIQGLAEAGILPSPLSGNSTTVTFRPDQPLTRETLLLWKVPMDLRQSLPKASLEAIQQTWGFQDAARIDPNAQRAVLADYQNGDQANIRRAFGYTTLFQPKKAVSRAEAAAALWYFGYQGEGQSAQEIVKGGTTIGAGGGGDEGVKEMGR
ncbi:S-layer homology domain-containing protein [Pantanalinema rosaneae CENA516]|uniref:S-layer homology domain-containing protein n=1 Tax=Pantanalinema rosaneae TaxID=1620701 RepID=UPI003D6F8443